MNIIINFYKELDTLNLIIFWGVIIVIILLLIFAIVISNKNRKLKLLLEKKEESHSNEKENIEITNNAIKENIVKEVYNEPIIPNDIKPHKDDTPKVLPENKEDKELPDEKEFIAEEHVITYHKEPLSQSSTQVIGAFSQRNEKSFSQ